MLYGDGGARGCWKEWSIQHARGRGVAGQEGLCEETGPGSEVFTRKYSKSLVQLDCKAWHGKMERWQDGKITMADGRVLEDQHVVPGQ